MIASLWNAGDKQAMELMTNLFQALADKHSNKATALQQAQLLYLNNITEHLEAHPYYWAGFVSIGDDSPLPPPNQSLNWLYLILPFGLGMGWLFWRKINAN